MHAVQNANENSAKIVERHRKVKWHLIQRIRIYAQTYIIIINFKYYSSVSKHQNIAVYVYIEIAFVSANCTACLRKEMHSF